MGVLKVVEKYTPKVNVAKELSEISKDFTNPRELVRETIANSLDASASRITVEAFKDDASGDDELVVKIVDDGVGMSRDELESFFDLGYSKKRKDGAIGNKGHGTKITYNSSLVTVTTRSIDGGTALKATLATPRKALHRAVKQNGDPPVVEFAEFEGPVDGAGSPFLPGSVEDVPLTVEKRKAIPRTIIRRSCGCRQVPFPGQGGPML